MVKSRLNETLLRQIATATGGFYLPLRGADTMKTLYEQGLAPLPKSEGEERLIRRYHEQYQWPLAAAILLLLVEMFLPERKAGRASRLPAGGTTIGEKPLERRTARTAALAGQAGRPPYSGSGTTGRVAALILLASIMLPARTFASPASALRDYKAGNYTNALQEFSRLAEIQTNDLRLVFNAGDAAYRATNFDEAANDCAAVTLSPDPKLQERAFYNLGNTQFQMAKSAKDLDGIQAGLETAEKSYRHALTLDTNDTDAAFNLAFVSNAVERIKEFRAAIERAKNEADISQGAGNHVAAAKNHRRQAV